jgi:hypothetical protein
MYELLNDPLTTSLISRSGKNNRIVVGVPHHAPLGTHKLPTLNKRSADENAGLVGIKLAEILDCSFIIACNYSFDVNKFRSSDYFRIIKQWQPQILIEIHGHGNCNAKYDIEISSGNIERNYLAQSLAENLIGLNSVYPDLAKYSISGDFKKIYFQATASKTINTDEWLSLHIELPLTLRKPCSGTDKTTNNLSDLFCNNLAESLKKTFKPENLGENYAV